MAALRTHMIIIETQFILPLMFLGVKERWITETITAYMSGWVFQERPGIFGDPGGRGRLLSDRRVSQINEFST